MKRQLVAGEQVCVLMTNATLVKILVLSRLCDILTHISVTV